MRSIKLLLIVLGLCFVVGASALRNTTELTSNEPVVIKSSQMVDDSLNINIGNTSARSYIRRGNKLYADSLYEKAGIEYKRALTVEPTSIEALYNYGNALLMRQKGEEALKQYSNATNLIKKNELGIAYNDKDKVRLADIYHNIGVLLQSAKQYDHCIEAYKKSLRNDPTNHETRYNLSLAQKMKKEQQEQQKQDSQQNQQEQQKQEKEQQNSQKEQEQQQEEQQKQQDNRQPQISKENAEQLLKAVMQDEKDIQEKVKKEMQEVQPRKFDKDW